MERLRLVLTLLAAAGPAWAAAPKLVTPATLGMKPPVLAGQAPITVVTPTPAYFLPITASLTPLPLPSLMLPAAAVPQAPRISAPNPFLPSAAAQSPSDERRRRLGDAADPAGPHGAAEGRALPNLNLAAADASRAFDNARIQPPAAAVDPVQGPSLPPYLASANAEEAAWIGGVVVAANRSKTGRGVLKKIEALAAQRGRPIIVIVERISNMGEYTFDHEVVTMDADGKKRSPEASAHIFIHELQHVLQFADDLPVDALEMELEAHIIQFQVAEELGYKAPRAEFHWKALTRLRNDPTRFIKWLQDQYKDNISIVNGGSVEAYETELNEKRLKEEASLKRLDKKLARKQAIYEQLVKTQQSARSVEQFRLDEVAPIEEKIRGIRRNLDWMARDFALLNDPARRKHYERYARRVLQRVHALHNRFKRQRGE